MSSWMTPEQIWQWRLSLEVKLRRLHGDGLQDFFSSVMERGHKSDFVRVRPYGRLGDKGCDGYVASTGQMSNATARSTMRPSTSQRRRQDE